MATRTYESLGTHPSGGAPSARWLALAVLCVSLLMVNLDNLVLNVALPTLVRDLHATTTELQWIVDAYVIVFAGLLLVAGSVADRIGRKRVFIVGLVAFAAGSTWAAFSGSVGMLIAARASMGIGGAMMMPSTLAVITNPRGHHEPVRDHVGVGSAANGAFLQVGGALGVAIIGSLLNTRYQDTMSAALAPFHVPHSVMGPVLGSIGGALGVAGHVGGFLGAELAHVSKTALSAEWTSA